MNIIKRVATAVVLLPIAFISIQYLPRFWFFCIIQVFILASLLEFYNLPRIKGLYLPKTMGIILSLIISFSIYFEEFPLGVALFCCLFLIGVYFVLTTNKIEKLVQFPSAIALTFFGVFYLSFTLNHFNLLRDEKGPYYLYFLIAVISMGDTGAFLFGRQFGRHKMAPLASPKKTWEGSIGGIVTACLTGILMQQLLFAEAVLWKAVLLAFIIHVVAQISDPLESLFKRAAGVKDSSNLLPGHGGFFDRLDSLILALPFFYYLLRYFDMQ
jgi:phosphatidate cytidylyltransferase